MEQQMQFSPLTMLLLAFTPFITFAELYPNNLKSWEFDKEGPQNFCPEQETIAERQGSSEDENFEANPTPSRPNFSSCLGRSTSKLKDAEIVNEVKISPLSNENSFAIYYVFEGDALNIALKEAMIQRFQTLGTVYQKDDDKLSELQKQDKYRPGGMIIEISASQITEDSSNNKLPVFEISMKVVGSAQILQNGSQAPVVIWEKEKFVGIEKKTQKFIENTVKAADYIFELFAKEYQTANPKTVEKKPQFFLYF